MLVHDLFDRTRRLHPERIAVTRLDQEWSYERLGRLSDQVATALGQVFSLPFFCAPGRSGRRLARPFASATAWTRAAAAPTA